MSLTLEVTVGDLLTDIVIAVTVAVYLHGRSAERKLAKAEFLREHSVHLLAYPDTSKLLMDIDYGRFKFGDSILDTREERTLIHLLGIANSLGFSYENKLLSLNDLSATTLGYTIVVLRRDREVSRYLDHIDHMTSLEWGSLRPLLAISGVWVTR